MLHKLWTLQEKTSELVFSAERANKSNKWQKVIFFLFLLSECCGYLSQDDAFLRQKKEKEETSLEEWCFSHFFIIFC